MTSRVRVDMTICDHKTIIEATARDDGMVDVKIKSTCRDVRDFAKMLPPLGPEDYTSMQSSKILDLAAHSRLTPTCLIPTAIFNVVWMEVGMISKRHALKEKSICIYFEE
jgi:hypothetical protein